MKRKYIIGLIILIILALVVFRLSSNKKALNEKNRPVKDSLVSIPVKVAAVIERPLTIDLIKTGTLAPFKEAKVFSTTSGTIRFLRFNLGDYVSEGQVLAVIDSRLAKLDLEKAEINAAKQRRDLVTYTELEEGQAATREKVNDIRQQYLDASNEVNRIRKQIGDASIRAPTSGIISEKQIEQGVFANSGSQIATIVNLSQAKVVINLTEEEVYLVKQGQSVKISIDTDPDNKYTGEITFISPQPDESHNYRIEIIAGNKDHNPLRSGSFVHVDFSRKTLQDVIFIPRDAIIQSVKDAMVYVVKNNKVRQKSVTTGLEQNGMIQILSGLKKDEQVVTSGQINLTDGTQVSISNNQ